MRNKSSAPVSHGKLRSLHNSHRGDLGFVLVFPCYIPLCVGPNSKHPQPHQPANYQGENQYYVIKDAAGRTHESRLEQERSPLALGGDNPLLYRGTLSVLGALWAQVGIIWALASPKPLKSVHGINNMMGCGGTDS